MKAVMQMMPASANSLATSPTRRMFSLRSCGREAEVAAQPVADVVAVQHIGVLAQVEQLALQFGGDGGLAGAGQAGEPDDAARVAVAAGPVFGGDLAVAPEQVVALVVAGRRAARVIVGQR